MKLRTKMVLGAILLAALPLTLASALIGLNAINQSTAELESEAENKLVAIRDMKRQQIEEYFDTIRNQVLTFSNDTMVINAMVAFSGALGHFRSQAEAEFLDEARIDEMRRDLSGYYRTDFTDRYRDLNHGQSPDADRLLSQLDPESIALQYYYIQDNRHPLGEKDGLMAAGDDSDYSRLHAQYHPHIRDFQNKFGYYDIFLADPETGDIVYSVFKELDYTTSLKDGPYAQSGIGRVFRKANAADDPAFVAVEDFQPYKPSYEGAASFIASPIFDGGEKVGVLIFQMPIGRINEIMTHRGQWKESGLGDSGETYLVGTDRKSVV